MGSGIRVAPDGSAVLIEAEAGNGVVKLKVTAQYARELAAKLSACANIAEGKRGDGKSVVELLQEAARRKGGNPFDGLF